MNNPAIMKKCLNLLVPVIVLAAFLLTGTTYLCADDGTKAVPPTPVKQVLILHSYYPSYIWTSQQTATFFKFFRDMKFPSIELFVEYLDSQRDHTPQYTDSLVQLFRQKYSNQEFDLILCCDNAALEFINNEGKNLFAQSPVVFCGVNKFSPSMLTSGRPTTGVEEKIEPAQTVELALKLHPNTKNVFIISGHSRKTSTTTLKQTLEALKPFKKQLNIEYSQETSMQELLEKVESLSPDTIVFMLLFSKDKNGHKFSPRQGLQMIAKRCKVPIYGVWQFYLGYGLTGGKLTCAQLEATLSARMAKRVLLGEPANTIPVDQTPHNKYMFDWKYLKKFNVQTSQLPPDSVVINKPVSFYIKYKKWIWLAIVGITIQSVLLLGFFINLIRRKKMERKLIMYKFVMDNSRIGIMVFNSADSTIYTNAAINTMWDKNSVPGNINELSNSLDMENREAFIASLKARQDVQIETKINSGKNIPVEITAYSLQIKYSIFECLFIKNITTRKQTEMEHARLETELHQAQKLESIGTLAAGIAHEINTPIQFIGDNTRFLSECMQDLLKLISAYEKATQDQKLSEQAQTLLQQTEEQVDLKFLKQELPEAIVQTMEGIDRVTTIVRAMKDFSHIGSDTMSREDINKAIESTVVISRNEWKYASELTMDLAHNLPLVECIIGDIKQVILNLIVNAAHAVADTKDKQNTTDKGLIAITTQCTLPNIIIKISDSGTGIPENIQHKIFDPFFTTKKIGKGTGQGLTIAYASIVEKHHGKIYFQTTPGKGTTFIIELPVDQPR